MNQVDLQKPSDYLVHWQCSPEEWHKFGKYQWNKSCFINVSLILFFVFSLILLLFGFSELSNNMFGDREALKNFFILLLAFCGQILFILFLVKSLKSDYLYYKKYRTNAVNIYISRKQIVIGNRNQKINSWFVDDFCRLKVGNPSILVLCFISGGKSLTKKAIVPVPRENESEALELLQILLQKNPRN